MGAKGVKFEIIQFPGARVIGKTTTVKEPTTLDDVTATDLLERMNKDGHYKFLLGLLNKFAQNADTVGWQGDFIPNDASYIYLAGVMFKPDAAFSDGYKHRDIAACEMAVAWISECEGDEGGDVFADASGNLANARSEHRYEYDGSNGFFEMECYSEKRFYVPKSQGKNIILDFYSPCKKAE